MNIENFMRTDLEAVEFDEKLRDDIFWDNVTDSRGWFN